MIRILIADDHPLVRKGIAKAVADCPEFTVVAEAGDGREALALLETIPVDLAILDISMPKMNGLEALAEIRKSYAGIPVLILSMHSEPLYASQALKDGASGFLPKDSSTDLLLEAIRKISQGGRFIDPKLAQELVWSMGDPTTPPHQALSKRELEVLRLICEGIAPKQIAGKLSVSVKTVSTFRSRILQKLGMESTADLIKYGLKHHLANADPR
jgi:DNA-binding NarL/FixJ family response regulator